MYLIAERLFGPMGGAAWAALLTIWALRMDVRFGALFGILEAGFALLGGWVLARTDVSIGTSAIIIVVTFLIEVSSHVVAQGHPPGQLFAVSKKHMPLIGLYFAIVFGLFFLNWDLAMRYLGYQPEYHRLLNESSNEWHRMAARAAGRDERKRAWHVRVIEAQIESAGS